MEPLTAPSPPPPLLSFADWRGAGVVTIIASPKCHTLVQVHDQPKGFYDCESFTQRPMSLRVSQMLFIAIVSQKQSIIVASGFNGGDFFLVFCHDSKNQDVPLEPKTY